MTLPLARVMSVKYKVASCFAFTALAALAPSVAHAQSYTIGGEARTFAMGGAGVALSQDRGTSSRSNPASLAFERRDVAPTFPSLGVRASGSANGNAGSNYLLSGARVGDSLSLVREFASRDGSFGLNGYTSLRFSKYEISASAVGVGNIYPNAILSNWFNNTERNFNELPDGAQGDVIAAGYYNLPSIAIGEVIPTALKSPNRIGVGVRLKSMNAVYVHHIATKEDILGNENGTLAPEMNGDRKLSKRGFGADIGFQMRPKKNFGVSYGLVVANVIKPNFTFNGTDRNGNPLRYSLLQTTATAGVGYEKNGLALAADLSNFTSAGGSTQLRLGAEQRFVRVLAARAGYNSQTGVTYGVGFYGLDVSFGSNVPLEVVKTFSF